MRRRFKYWETTHVVPAGKSLIHCTDCNEVVSVSASQCPSCGSRQFFGSQKPPRGRERQNDNTIFFATVGLCAFGIAHGIATASTTSGAIFAATWQGALGALAGVPVGSLVNFLRFFGGNNPPK